MGWNPNATILRKQSKTLQSLNTNLKSTRGAQANKVEPHKMLPSSSKNKLQKYSVLLNVTLIKNSQFGNHVLPRAQINLTMNKNVNS